jgi:hypothetical protein
LGGGGEIAQAWFDWEDRIDENMGSKMGDATEQNRFVKTQGSIIRAAKNDNFALA